MRYVYLMSLIVPLTFVACDKKAKDEGKGSIQTETTQEDGGTEISKSGSLIISATLPESTTSTHVAAFPIQDGGVSSGSVSGARTQAVEAGAVAISIEGAMLHLTEGDEENGDDEGGMGGGGGEVSHVMIAYKEGADRFETGESFKFINVPVGESQALNLFTGEVKTDKIDLGQIAEDGDKLVAGNPIKEGDFSIATAVLEELAAGDGALRSIKNAYMNTDPVTGKSVEIRPFFQWSQKLEDSVNTFSAGDAATYFGYGLYFDTDRTEFSMENLCNSSGGGFKALKLVPPGPLTIGSYTDPNSNSQINELSNAGAGEIKQALGTRTECSGASFYAHGDTSGKDLGWNWGGIVGPIADGYWDLFLGSEKTARFDLAAIFPFDSDGKTLVYLPSIKVTTTGTKVTGVEIKFFRYVKGVLTEVTDLTAFRKIVREFGVSFTSFTSFPQSGQQEEYKTFGLPETGTSLSPDLSKYGINWHIGSGDLGDGIRVGAFAFQYNMYGNDFRFELRPAQ